jgi:Fur family ferric uptake transcriptional regulator
MPDSQPSRLEQICMDRGMKMTGQRRVIARVLSDAHDHPDVEELYRRSVKMDPKISIATVYRTVRLFEEAGLLERRDFGDGRARYEEHTTDHHDHLIDMQSGKVFEFNDGDVEELQIRIAKKLGYKLVGHRMELYGVPIEGKKSDD